MRGAGAEDVGKQVKEEKVFVTVTFQKGFSCKLLGLYASNLFRTRLYREASA
jgi:hypothetical protein